MNVKLNKIKVNGKAIQELRQRRGLTQEELGEIIGIKKPTISNYECDHGNPSGAVMLRLLMYFNVPPVELVTFGE
jgi:transcriptional regulator with XRE-family HTH domain